MAKGKTSTGTAPAATGEKTKAKKYPTMIIGIGRRTEEHKKLDDLAISLGCKTSDLIWVGVERVLADPPKIAPAGAVANIGTAPGFWVVPQFAPNGKPTGVKVLEVESRSQISNGRTFFRYDKNDETGKSRDRAQRQAIKAGATDMQLMGLKPDGLKTEKLAA